MGSYVVCYGNDKCYRGIVSMPEAVSTALTLIGVVSERYASITWGVHPMEGNDGLIFAVSDWDDPNGIGDPEEVCVYVSDSLIGKGFQLVEWDAGRTCIHTNGGIEGAIIHALAGFTQPMPELRDWLREDVYKATN